MLIVSPNICIYDCVYSESLLSSKNSSTAYWTLVHEYQNYIKHTMSKAKCLFFRSSFFLPKMFFSFFIVPFLFLHCSLFHYSQLKILDSFLHLLFSHTLHHIPILCFLFFKPILLYLSITNFSPQLLILGSTARNNLQKHSTHIHVLKNLQRLSIA